MNRISISKKQFLLAIAAILIIFIGWHVIIVINSLPQQLYPDIKSNTIAQNQILLYRFKSTSMFNLIKCDGSPYTKQIDTDSIQTEGGNDEYRFIYMNDLQAGTNIEIGFGFSCHTQTYRSIPSISLFQTVFYKKNYQVGDYSLTSEELNNINDRYLPDGRELQKLLQIRAPKPIPSPF